MNTISLPVAKSIAKCFENIKADNLITTQIFEDSFPFAGDTNNSSTAIVNRNLVVKSERKAGKIHTIFTIIEGYSDRTVVRTEFDDVETALVTDGNAALELICGAYTLHIDIAPSVVEVGSVEEELVPVTV